MGVDAMCECVDLVRDGKAQKIPQDDSKATYESWCRKADAQIDWSKPVDVVYNLIRGANPQPGAWTTHDGKTLQIFDAEKIASAAGTPGEVTEIGGDGFKVAAKGGQILVKRVKPEGGGKLAAAEFAQSGLAKGARLG